MPPPCKTQFRITAFEQSSLVVNYAHGKRLLLGWSWVLVPFPMGLVGGLRPLHCEALSSLGPNTEVHGACAEAQVAPV